MPNPHKIAESGKTTYFLSLRKQILVTNLPTKLTLLVFVRGFHRNFVSGILLHFETCLQICVWNPRTYKHTIHCAILPRNSFETFLGNHYPCFVFTPRVEPSSKLVPLLVSFYPLKASMSSKFTKTSWLSPIWTQLFARSNFFSLWFSKLDPKFINMRLNDPNFQKGAEWAQFCFSLSCFNFSPVA